MGNVINISRGQHAAEAVVDIIRDRISDELRFISMVGVQKFQTPMGTHLECTEAYAFRGAEVAGQELSQLYINYPDLLYHRGWDSRWMKIFHLTTVRIAVKLDIGTSHACYVRFEDVLQCESTPEWQAQKSASDAARLQAAIDSERRQEEYQAEHAAEQKDLVTVAGDTTEVNRLARASAFRRIASRLQHRVDGHFSVWGADAAQMLGLPYRPGKVLPAKTTKKLNELVSAGVLHRTRTIGWQYSAKSVQAYVLYLADQLEPKQV